MCAKKTPSRMQNERTGELNLGINIKTFNSNISFSNGKNYFLIQRIRRPTQRLP